ncbi:MAG: hypothetical protein HeimC2_29230 [Candidatus Heimdallarchaeota archaeon LC_2]|nr:MAG: hypothetical protein HeimC2_29230 [Candidatus Heimdallarchaeota archaeon LC_2]
MVKSGINIEGIEMSEDCKSLEKKAKGFEKDNLMEAIEHYKQAANCFGINDKQKDQSSNLEKAAKLLRNLGKDIHNPVEALVEFTKSSEVYIEAGKPGEAEKVMLDAQHKFEESVRRIRSEVKNLENPEEAEKKLVLASEYALQAKNEPLSRECWIDSAEIYRISAKKIDEPREALEVFKNAIHNYLKGESEERKFAALIEAADKFNEKAEKISKTKKQLILAIDNYLQAGTIYESAKAEDQATNTEIQIHEICDTIGLPIEFITSYLESQNIFPIILD